MASSNCRSGASPDTDSDGDSAAGWRTRFRAEPPGFPTACGGGSPDQRLLKPLRAEDFFPVLFLFVRSKSFQRFSWPGSAPAVAPDPLSESSSIFFGKGIARGTAGELEETAAAAETAAGMATEQLESSSLPHKSSPSSSSSQSPAVISRSSISSASRISTNRPQMQSTSSEVCHLFFCIVWD